MTREPDSRRYWRLNTLDALRFTRVSERDALDPEDLVRIRSAHSEQQRLEARERAVQTRRARRLTLP
jgi:hypothetical protein